MKTHGPRGLVMLALVAFVLVHMVLLLVHRLPHGDEFRYVHEFTPQGKSLSEFVGWHPFVAAMSVQSWFLLGPLSLDSVYSFRAIALLVSLGLIVVVVVLYRSFHLPALAQVGFVMAFTWSLFFGQFGTSAILWYIETALLGCVSFLILESVLAGRLHLSVPSGILFGLYFCVSGWFHPGLSFLACSLVGSYLLMDLPRWMARRNKGTLWQESRHMGIALAGCAASLCGSAIYLRYFAHSQLFRRKEMLAEFYFDLSSYSQTVPGALRYTHDRILNLTQSVFALSGYPALTKPGKLVEVLSQVAVWAFVMGLIWGLIASGRTRRVILGFCVLLIVFAGLGLAGIYPLGSAKGYRYFTFALVYFYLIFGFGVAAAGQAIRWVMGQLAARRGGLGLAPSARGVWSAGGLTLILLVLVSGDVRVWSHLDHTRADFLATLYRPDLAPVLVEERGYRALFSMGQLPPRIVRFNEKRQQLRPLRRQLRRRGEVAMVMVGGLRINQNLRSELEGKRLSARPLSRHSSLGLYWLTADDEKIRRRSR